MPTTTADIATTNFMGAATKFAKGMEPDIPDGLIESYVVAIEQRINLGYDVAASSLSLVLLAAAAALNSKDFKEATRRGDELKRMLDFVLSEEMFTQMHKDFAAKEVLASGRPSPNIHTH